MCFLRVEALRCDVVQALVVAGGFSGRRRLRSGLRDHRVGRRFPAGYGSSKPDAIARSCPVFEGDTALCLGASRLCPAPPQPARLKRNLSRYPLPGRVYAQHDPESG